MTGPSNHAGPRVAIIGFGFAGLCLAMQLEEAGFHDFTIFEKGPRLGGTWRDNTYPGAACDIASLSYCFSFERNPEWTRKWATQPEILAYMDRCARKYDLLRRVRFGVEIARARFAAGVWHLETTRGERFEADVLVSAVGQLSRPAVPAIEGLDTFGGRAFHAARWPEGEDLAGQRVAIVGNAASGVQIVPAIAPRAKRLLVFQRSANWILPKNDRTYSALERLVLRASTPVASVKRWWIWASNEARLPVFKSNRVFAAVAALLARRHLEAQVADPALRLALTPDYPIGAKRILISDDYYPALQQPNVRLVTAPIARVTREGLVTRDGERWPVDSIVFATGFHTTEMLAPMHIEGQGGVSLERTWRDGASAYLGISVSGFPNLFLMYGPNTGLGHNSVLFMLECQARYILDGLRQMRRDDLLSIDVRPEVQAAYDADLQQALGGTAWAAIDSSWYKNERGRIVANWPYSTAAYWARTRHLDLRRYVVAVRPEGRVRRSLDSGAVVATAERA
jgi:cation diffusion facilitator CzcD-associated flavoprotein CzcO